jgi:hypothetical protein
MTTTSLQQIFGLIPSTVDHYINFGLNVLEATLGEMLLACVSWPVGMKMKEYEGMILECHGLLEGAFGSIDGLNLTPSENLFELDRMRSEARGVVSPELDLSEYIVVWNLFLCVFVLHTQDSGSSF